MQRWIAVGVVAMILLIAGGGFARHIYHQNRPQAMWVALPINAELPMAKRDALIKDLKAKLSEQALLVRISRAEDLPHKWNLPSDNDAVRKLRECLFVRAGEADSPMGKIPSINIGVTDKYKEQAVSGAISVRLMDEVRKILGIPAAKERHQTDS